MEYTTDSVSFPRRVAIPLPMGVGAGVSSIGTSCDTDDLAWGRRGGLRRATVPLRLKAMACSV